MDEEKQYSEEHEETEANPEPPREDLAADDAQEDAQDYVPEPPPLMEAPAE
jgi:hypothetical protein